MRKFLGLLLLAPGLALGDTTSAYQPLAFLADRCWKGAFPGGAAKPTNIASAGSTAASSCATSILCGPLGSRTRWASQFISGILRPISWNTFI